MMSDIHLLQQTPTEKLFLSASNLFLNKWREREHAFTEMFEGNYLKKANKWAEAFSKLCPSTNNGLEATNAAIKENKTLRERLPPIFLWPKWWRLQLLGQKEEMSNQ